MPDQSNTTENQNSTPHTIETSFSAEPLLNPVLNRFLHAFRQVHHQAYCYLDYASFTQRLHTTWEILQHVFHILHHVWPLWSLGRAVSSKRRTSAPVQTGRRGTPGLCLSPNAKGARRCRTESRFLQRLRVQACLQMSDPQRQSHTTDHVTQSQPGHVFPRHTIIIMRAATLSNQSLIQRGLGHFCQRLTPDLDLAGSRSDTKPRKSKKYGDRPEGYHVRGLGVERGEASVLKHHSDCIYTDLGIWVSEFS